MIANSPIIMIILPLLVLKRTIMHIILSGIDGRLKLSSMAVPNLAFESE